MLNQAWRLRVRQDTWSQALSHWFSCFTWAVIMESIVVHVIHRLTLFGLLCVLNGYRHLCATLDLTFTFLAIEYWVWAQLHKLFCVKLEWCLSKENDILATTQKSLHCQALPTVVRNNIKHFSWLCCLLQSNTFTAHCLKIYFAWFNRWKLHFLSKSFWKLQWESNCKHCVMCSSVPQ